MNCVSVGKLSERMSNFWMAQFLKTESELNFGFPHIPSWQCLHVGNLKAKTRYFQSGT